MKCYLDGKQIVIEEAPGFTNRVININASHCRMTQSDVGDPETVTIVDGLYDVGYTDLLANTTDSGATVHTFSTLRAIIG